MKKIHFFILMNAFVLSTAAGGEPVIQVYKNAGCSCCGTWETHLKEAGFTVQTQIVDNVPVFRKKLGMPEAYASCHTAKVGDYLVEGHVPAADIRRLLREKPKAIGIAAPGMPVGSPGMESDMPQDYDVLLITKDRKSRLFQRHLAAKATNLKPQIPKGKAGQ